MVPGIASDYSNQDGVDGILPPVCEYNKKDTSIDINNPKRPRFEPLHQGLKKQGLYKDFERGPSSSSARRSTPSNVYGMLSPNGNTIHIDDDNENEFIRLRTRGGAQVLIHETTGYVYINSKFGNSWLEVSDDGINMFSRGNISIRSEQDVNIRADKNINFSSGSNTAMVAGAKTQIEGGSGISMMTGAKILQTGAEIHTSASKVITSASNISQKAGTITRDGSIDDNNGLSSSAEQATQVPTVSHAVQGGSFQSHISTAPGHEPWAGHPKSSNIDPPRGDLGEVQAVDQPVNDTKQRNVIQITGDGKNTETAPSSLSGEKINISPKVKIDKTVLQALRKASSITGVELLFLLVVCEKESTFNPTAKAPTTGATGLFQFVPNTWAGEICKKYGSQYGFTNTYECKVDPDKGALAGALYLKSNKLYLEQRLNRSVSWTEVYLAHFLGGGGAVRFLKAMDTNANAPVNTAVSSDSYAANAPSFKKKDGTPKTVREVYDSLNNWINAKRSQYVSIN